MKHFRCDGGFILCLFLNLFFNLEFSIPAWIALVLYFIFHISIWWFIGLIIIWISYVFIVTCFLSWVSSCGNDKPKVQENKNPYSNREYK